MAFMIKAILALTVIFYVLPEQEAEKVRGEISRAVAQDTTVKATVERTNKVANHLAVEAQKICFEKSAECLNTTAEVLTGVSIRR